MLSSISWGEYLSAVLISLACYYAYVGYKYFQWEILAAIGIKKLEHGTTPIPVTEFKNQIISESHADYLPKENTDADISPMLSSFEDEIKAFLLEVGSSTDKDALLINLRHICKKYPVLKYSDTLNELNKFILLEIEKYQPELINIEDIQQLWR